MPISLIEFNEDVIMKDKIPAIHPGEILKEEFLEPMDISQVTLARDINVSPVQINEIVPGKSSITASIALRLARYLGNSPQFWINLQTHYDLEVEMDKPGDILDKEVKVCVNS